MAKQRLDVAMAERGLAESRQKAQVGNLLLREIPGVGPLHADHLGVDAQPVIQLVTAGVHGGFCCKGYQLFTNQGSGGQH